MGYVLIVVVKFKNLKMLYPRLTDCLECGSIPSLLKDIDCKLNKLALNLYNNNIFLLNLNIPRETFSDLLKYKRILTYRLVNPDYASKYKLDDITGKVKLLIHK